MLRLFAIPALRSLLRHKLQTLINIFSLAIGLTVFGFAFLYVKDNLSVNRGWPDNDRVHRLLIEFRGLPGVTDGVFSSVSTDDWPLIQQQFTDDFEAVTRSSVTAVRWLDAESPAYTNMWFVDPQFPEVFQPEVLEGDLERTFSGPGFFAVDETTAGTLGFTGRVGERFTITSFNEGDVEYELAAIYRLPEPRSGSTSFTMLSLLHDYSRPLFRNAQGVDQTPWQRSYAIWTKLKPGVNTTEFNARQADFVQHSITRYNDAIGAERQVSDHLIQHWQPLTDIWFSSLLSDGGDPARVATVAVVGLLVLAVGSSNSVSLSLAAALERRREIGVRKAAGALPQDIVRQYLGASVLLALLAVALAGTAIELLLPAFRALLYLPARFTADWADYAMLVAIATCVGLACGVYPALVLSATRPQAVLRAGALRVKGGTRLRTLLVAVQFCFASMLMIGTTALYLQLAFTRAQPLGFDPTNKLFMFTNSTGASPAAMRIELEKIPGVTRVINGFSQPNANMSLTTNIRTLVRNTVDSNEVKPQYQAIDYDFIEMMGIRLLAGRNYDSRIDAFSQQSTQFADGGERKLDRVMLNMNAARQLGFAIPEEAVGKTVYYRFFNRDNGAVIHGPVMIIGVVEDNLYASVRRRTGPEAYSVPGDFASGNFLLKYEESAEASVQNAARELILRMGGNSLVNVLHVETQLDAAFSREQNESKLLLICGGMALVLASFGLYGLAAFAIERQIKEVGVRKVMGASVATIVRLYLWRFTRPIIAANLLAWPVAIYFVLEWIERFPYQMERAWLAPLCIATLGAVLVIALLTVSVLTTRAATVNPVRSLRYE